MKIKLYFICAFALVIIFAFLQNLGRIDINFFLWEINAPKVYIFFTIYLAGIITGVLLSFLRR